MADEQLWKIRVRFAEKAPFMLESLTSSSLVSEVERQVREKVGISPSEEIQSMDKQTPSNA